MLQKTLINEERIMYNSPQTSFVVPITYYYVRVIKDVINISGLYEIPIKLFAIQSIQRKKLQWGQS